MDTIFAQKMSLKGSGQGCLECDVHLCPLSNLCLPLGSQVPAQPQDPRMLHNPTMPGQNMHLALSDVLPCRELVELRARLGAVTRTGFNEGWDSVWVPHWIHSSSHSRGGYETSAGDFWESQSSERYMMGVWPRLRSRCAARAALRYLSHGRAAQHISAVIH